MRPVSLDWLGSVFADSLAENVRRFTSLNITVQSSEPDYGFDSIVGVMHLGGNNNGTVWISANERDMRIICSYMLGVSGEEVTDEDITDALSELVNMTAGNVKLRLSNMDFSFSLTPPFALIGGNMSIVPKKRVEIVSRLLTGCDISMRLKIFLYNY